MNLGAYGYPAPSTSDLGSSGTVREAVKTGGNYWHVPPGTSSLKTQTANLIGYFPLLVDAACTLNRVALNITSAATAGGVSTLGLYNSSEGLPSTLIAAWGNIATDAAGQIELSISQPITPSPSGLYWIAGLPDRNFTAYGGGQSIIPMKGLSSIDLLIIFGNLGYQESRTFSSGLPSVATPNMTVGSSDKVARYAVRIA